MADFWEVTLSLLKGFGENCQIFIYTLIAALPLGLIITFGSMAKFKPLKYITKAFVWVIRGTPLMLQLFIAMYIPGILFDIRLPEYIIGIDRRMFCALAAFIINYAAYFSEIFRGGIESIPKGQYEAGQVLGMTKTQIFFKVVLMQVVKRTIPPMSNEIITLVKDTSLARVVSGVTEILHGAYNYTRMGLIWPLFSTGLFFLAFNGILTLLFGYIEKKLDYYKG